MRIRHGHALAGVILTALVAGVAGPAPAMDIVPPGRPVDPFHLYGKEIRFRVMRNGDEVGRHTVTFERRDGMLEVTSRMNIAIKVLLVTVYRYSYESVGLWKEGGLQSLTAAVDDDGEKSTVDVDLVGGRLRVQGPKGELWTEAGTLPTTHWNPRQVAQSKLINTLTGGIDQVTIADRGEETVPTGEGPARARRFGYSGDLDIDSWYDADGHWMKMVFKGRDGSTIEYLCVSCRHTNGNGTVR
ncbi:MAG: DUF6134 family protein [Acetobacterales bacterium]